ncbi:MAG TPA: uracil-DNA glycosylase [Rubrivivax sp.]|nr:uracil-DNA glycosylase [Rubrivivax sp.]
MSWSAQQQKMLAAMGLRVWAPPLEQPVDEVPLAAAPRAAAEFGQQAPQAPGAPAAPAALRDGAASSSASSGLDWPALRKAVAGCRACVLCETRTQTVFGVGHPQAHWMVIGEAPGEQEDLQGEPFVGPAGQLLDRMLAALNLTRASDGDAPPAQRVFIANTLKCRPPRNRNPTPEELQRCEPFLMRQIELVQPKIILAMGAFAVKALLRSDQPVGRLRGQVHRYHGVPLVVTYHPAYLLRSLTEKAKAWEDLCLAAEVVEQADQHAPRASAYRPPN